MSPPEAAIAALHSALGTEALSDEHPLEIDGTRLAWTLRPPDGPGFAAALRILSERSLRALVRGGGSRDALGNLPRDPDLVLSTTGLAGVHELDTDEGVARVGGGTLLAAVRAATAGTGWELPFDPPQEPCTLGGSLASAAPCLEATRARDVVLGLEVVLASGERVRCGGRVVKNVTGYDLAKLFVGSHGSLAVIEAAWLRLRPVPERTLLVAASLAQDESGAARALEVARRPGVRVAVHLDASLAGAVLRGAEGPRLLAELAGDAAVVAADEAWLCDTLGAVPQSPDTLERLRTLHASPPGESALRFRVSALPSRVGRTAARLAAAGAQVLTHPGRGLLLARFGLDRESDPDAVGVAFEHTRCAADFGRGAYLLEAGPSWAKRGRDVFGELGPALPLMRALKQQYDPGGVLNPGRYAGHL